MRTRPIAIVAAPVVGCGGSTPTTPTSPGNGAPPVPIGNRPPVISSATMSPSWGMADVQPFEYRVTATDADGDRLAYRLDFGAGVLVTDAPVFGITYPSPADGSPRVHVSDGLLTVSDGKGGLAMMTVAAAAVATVSGNWTISSGALAGGILKLVQFQDGSLRGGYQLP